MHIPVGGGGKYPPAPVSAGLSQLGNVPMNPGGQGGTIQFGYVPIVGGGHFFGFSVTSS